MIRKEIAIVGNDLDSLCNQRYIADINFDYIRMFSDLLKHRSICHFKKTDF